MKSSNCFEIQDLEKENEESKERLHQDIEKLKALLDDVKDKNEKDTQEIEKLKSQLADQQKPAEDQAESPPEKPEEVFLLSISSLPFFSFLVNILFLVCFSIRIQMP